LQKIAFEEQQAIFEGNRTPTYADLQNMKYLEKVIKESLRLYPSVPIYGRKAIEDIQCGNNDVSLYLMFLLAQI
jgi:cytochrome P450 family 4